jgi:hypothetical protein
VIAIPLLTICLWVLAAVVGYYFLSGFVWGAGYAPTSKSKVESIANLLELKNGSFYDLGSGFGRIVLCIAEKYEVNCVGIEIDPIKCWWTNRMIRRKKLQGRVVVVQSNFLKVSLRDADKVFVFLSRSTNIMEKLRKKMWNEMKAGSLVVSYMHSFENWAPVERRGDLMLYAIPDTTPEQTTA